eukprot:2741963-Prymnesium_polylepis.1
MGGNLTLWGRSSAPCLAAGRPWHGVHSSRGAVATSRLRSAAAPGVLAVASSPAASSHCSPSG